MPNLEGKIDRSKNPRYDAMKQIVQNRLNAKDGETGKSLRDTLEEQNAEIMNPEAEIAPETKTVDTHTGGPREHQVDMESDSFNPAETAAEIETDAAQDETPPDTDEDREVDGESRTAEATGTGAKTAKKPEVEENAVTDLPVYKRDGKLYTKIKVGGEEQEIEFDKLRASAQKDKASYERFEAAARKEQELAVEAARLKKLREELESKQVQAPKDSQETKKSTPVDVSATVNALYDALAYEDEDTVKAKLAELVSGHAQTKQSADSGRGDTSTQPTEQPNREVDVEAAVEAALRAHQQREWETQRVTALSVWEQEYEDVANDADLRDVANRRSAQLMDENSKRDLLEVMREAGEYARKWKAFNTGTLEQPDTESRSERKRSAPAPVRGNGATASRKVEDDTPPTRSEVVAAIRKARGQAAP